MTTDDDFYGLEPGLPNTFLVFGNVSEEDQLFINSMFEQMRNLHAENPRLFELVVLLLADLINDDMETMP